jgi:hypothetical protein
MRFLRIVVDVTSAPIVPGGGDVVVHATWWRDTFLNARVAA